MPQLLGALLARPGRAWLGKRCAAMPDLLPERPSDGAAISASELMARLTLSALEMASADPAVWREPVVHQAVLVSGLSVLMGSLVRLRADLPGPGSAH